MIAKYKSCEITKKNLSQSSLGTLCLDLSTFVYDFLWITVENLSIKGLQLFLVDKWCTKHPVYPQLIHSPVGSISACKCPTQKKSLTNYLHIHRAYYNY